MVTITIGLGCCTWSCRGRYRVITMTQALRCLCAADDVVVETKKR
jgi:hypothetical protein